ncbi:MAG: tetratricopeptide repeat protein [Chloroflexi bacterium]|nr:tetratricopeptide repeat protein [Chloroflexota bacterium]
MKPAIYTDLSAADALYRAGKFAEAEAAYRKVKALDPKNSLVLERLGLIALWNNRPQEAGLDLKEALRCTPRYKNFWPFNAELNYRLGLTYYRQDQFAKAAQRFHEAAGPIAIGPFRELNALARQTALFTHAVPYVIEGPEQSQIDFMVTDPLPVIEVSVNGGRPLHFFIDTGGAEIILDKKLAEEVKAEMAGAFSTDYAGKKKAETGLGKIDSIRVGEIVVRNMPIHTLDVSSMSSVFNGLEIHGVIGTRFLMHFLSTIDYVNGALLLRRLTQATAQSLEAQIVAGGAKAIPFWLIDTHYMVSWGTVNHRGPMLLFVDTGLAGNGFTAPEPVLQDAGIIVDWTQTAEGIGGGGKIKGTGIVVDRLTLGTGVNEIVENKVPGVAIEKSVSILGDQLGFHIGGLISHQFFRNYALTLDFNNMHLLIQRSN